MSHQALAWPTVEALLATELGEPVHCTRALPVRGSGRGIWFADAGAAGELVVKARFGDRAHAKTTWCASRLPLLGARGFPVPAIVWHGMLDDDWHVTVQNRLPGRPLTSVTPAQLDTLLALVELQADAAIPADDRDFGGYVTNVLFDDWDEIWTDAAASCPSAAALCERLRRWLQPVWGMTLPPADFANNDLNLSNVLADGSRITGVVDWDEFGLGSRALDLVALAFDCAHGADHAAADRLLERAASVAGRDGLRCLISYRAIAYLATSTRDDDREGAPAVAATFSALVDWLVTDRDG
jgi:aminoglycoside phosphotransferase (APT) family kinase protein